MIALRNIFLHRETCRKSGKHAENQKNMIPQHFFNTTITFKHNHHCTKVKKKKKFWLFIISGHRRLIITRNFIKWDWELKWKKPPINHLFYATYYKLLDIYYFLLHFWGFLFEQKNIHMHCLIKFQLIRGLIQIDIKQFCVICSIYDITDNPLSVKNTVSFVVYWECAFYVFDKNIKRWVVMTVNWKPCRACTAIPQ